MRYLQAKWDNERKDLATLVSTAVAYHIMLTIVFNHGMKFVIFTKEELAHETMNKQIKIQYSESEPPAQLVAANDLLVETLIPSNHSKTSVNIAPVNSDTTEQSQDSSFLFEKSFDRFKSPTTFVSGKMSTGPMSIESVTE